MKNSTVLAAALAAGLMTFAAYAGEETAEQVTMLSPDRDIAPAAGKAKRDSAGREEGKDTKADESASADKEEPATAGIPAVSPQDRYRPFVEKYASENDVPLELAHAVITIESNYKASSLGKAGEIGLMQIKPTTAKLMGYGGSRIGLFDPETNIKYGMKYLGKARKLGGGTTCGTILKYNAGHAAKRMNSTSRDYCSKVKRHLATTAVEDVASPDSENERGT